MENNFDKIKNYIMELGFDISVENKDDQVFVIQDENLGIKNLVIGCADPILIMEQFILDVQHSSKEMFQELLQKNRDIVHGAFVLDETGGKVIFRDTLQLENLDKNELEGSINSLTLLLSEYGGRLIEFSKN
ncbi:MAG: molecular chaperone Tir [Flavobacteriales bacterium]|nr:molecular chaperone Tir [Flavobacteriales bacterium]|tara:strand:- start:11428 stop:11823 length:396 start_codon:yes stop_codon:yes gene_type:complete